MSQKRAPESGPAPQEQKADQQFRRQHQSHAAYKQGKAFGFQSHRENPFLLEEYGRCYDVKIA